MAKIVENGDNSVHLERHRESISLTIGVEPYRHRGRGKNRNTPLNAKQGRRLAVELLIQAEELDEAASAREVTPSA